MIPSISDDAWMLLASLHRATVHGGVALLINFHQKAYAELDALNLAKEINGQVSITEDGQTALRERVLQEATRPPRTDKDLAAGVSFAIQTTARPLGFGNSSVPMAGLNGPRCLMRPLGKP